MAQQSYMSVNRYLSGGYGIDTSTFTRAALRNVLVRSTTAVNRYCAVPSFPQPFDFRGGTVIGEQHQWPYVDPLLINQGSRRVFLNQKPLRTVIAFSLQLAENYVVTLDPATNCVVNSAQGYVEVVALTPVISGYFPVGWNFGIWNPLASVSYTYGWTFDVVGDECEAESPNLYTASYGNWSATPPVVYINGAVQNPTGYTVNRDDGSIFFTTPPSIQLSVTVDYSYTLPDAIAQATGIVATNLIGGARMAGRGMVGLQSIRVAEVAITALQPSQMVTKNGSSIPAEAADLLGGFTMGSAA